MENGPFIDGLPIKKWGFSMAMLNNQRVISSLAGDEKTYRLQETRRWMRTSDKKWQIQMWQE